MVFLDIELAASSAQRLAVSALLDACVRVLLLIFLRRLLRSPPWSRHVPSPPSASRGCCGGTQPCKEPAEESRWASVELDQVGRSGTEYLDSPQVLIPGNPKSVKNSWVVVWMFLPYKVGHHIVVMCSCVKFSIRRWRVLKEEKTSTLATASCFPAQLSGHWTPKLNSNKAHFGKLFWNNRESLI